MDALHRFKKFSQPFLNPDKADPNEELKNRVQKKDLEQEREEKKERQRKLLESVTEVDSDDDDEDSKKPVDALEDIVVEEEEIKEDKKEKEVDDKENNVPTQRKMQIERKVSSSDSKTSAAQEQANKYLKMLEQKRKTQKGPVQKMKFDVEAYSRVNNPDSRKSVEDRERLNSLINETASFSQLMETG